MTSKDDDKAKRLAAALRENLKRRKAQAREARSAEPAVGDRHRHSDGDQDRDQGAGPHSG